MGHEDIKTTQRYILLDDSDFKDVISTYDMINNKKKQVKHKKDKMTKFSLLKEINEFKD